MSVDKCVKFIRIQRKRRIYRYFLEVFESKETIIKFEID